MSSVDRILVSVGVALAALLLPATSSAHVGKSAPVATNFTAQITDITPPTDAVRFKVVDGDRALWLRVNANATAVIPGAEREPLLRFDHSGVFVNLRSLTAQSDRIGSLYLRPDPDPHARPIWRRVATGHSYLWHEHRLHVLEPLAQGRRATSVLGHWSVPVLIDGELHAVHGTLVFHPPGSLWPWVLLAIAVALAAAVARTLSPARARHVAVIGALCATMLIWLIRLGRELYGRPTMGTGGEIAIALTALVGIGLACGLLYRDEEVRFFTAFLVGFGCLYEAVTMYPVLTHADALSVLPTAIVRPCVAAIIVLGAGILPITLRELFAARAKPLAVTT